MSTKKVVIIGAGPAGLTAGLELQKLGLVNLLIIEADTLVGGISKTVSYGGNRIDIGGHRFFSKSTWVMDWWTNILPIFLDKKNEEICLSYHGQNQVINSATKLMQNKNQVMLLRSRLSRIYFNKNFFEYPLKLTLSTLKKIGLKKAIEFGFSYLLSKLYPRNPEKSLEDFLINRFGRKLFEQFFKDYTEKVWGVSCSQISANWGAQRIKSLSIAKTIIHAIRKKIKFGSVGSKQTSLIEYFLYPKYGPGQMWETVANHFKNQGGSLKLNCRVTGINIEKNRIQSVSYQTENSNIVTVECDYLVSTMPIKDLVEASNDYWTHDVQEIAKNLSYRDFITIGLLYKKENFKEQLDDNWIYIQEPGVKVGRVQIFNNWSPHMVMDPDCVWLGLEYFCQDTDALWRMNDVDLKTLAQQEMHQIGLVMSKHAIDSVVIKVPKAYPGYFGESYKKFHILQKHLDAVENLFLIGRNGMHRYNNQDHSMLTAAEAAQQISSGLIDKSKIWSINVDDDYHEEVSNK